jgi:hypothetical protein
LGDFQLLQRYLPQTEVKRQAITSTTLNDIVRSLLDEVSDCRHARSGASGIAGDKKTVRTDRGAEAAPQRCRGERVSPYS